MDAKSRRAKWSRIKLKYLLLLLLLAGPISPYVWTYFVEYIELRSYQSKFESANKWVRDSPQAVGPVPDDTIVLVRQGEEYGAFILNDQSLKPEQIKYTWYRTKNGKPLSKDSSGDVLSGEGTSKHNPGLSFGKSLAKVEFGPFKISWSSNGDGWGFLYFNDTKEPKISEKPLEMCVTGRSSFTGLDPTDSKWKYESGL